MTSSLPTTFDVRVRNPRSCGLHSTFTFSLHCDNRMAALLCVETMLPGVETAEIRKSFETQTARRRRSWRQAVVITNTMDYRSGAQRLALRRHDADAEARDYRRSTESMLSTLAAFAAALSSEASALLTGIDAEGGSDADYAQAEQFLEWGRGVSLFLRRELATKIKLRRQELSPI